jgi:hypothetical protein
MSKKLSKAKVNLRKHERTMLNRTDRRESRAGIQKNLRTPDNPPICEEDNVEMEPYSDAADTGKSGWACPECGWSFDE